MITSNTNNYVLIYILVYCYQNEFTQGQTSWLQTIITYVNKMVYSLVHVNDWNGRQRPLCHL